MTVSSCIDVFPFHQMPLHFYETLVQQESQYPDAPHPEKNLVGLKVITSIVDEKPQSCARGDKLGSHQHDESHAHAEPRTDHDERIGRAQNHVAKDMHAARPQGL